MLWTVRHLQPSVARFFFNCYRHWSSLVFWNGNGTASFLHSKVGMTQGYPLSINAYRIGILPLIKNIKQEIPDFPQPWYADDAGDLGTLARIETYFNLLTHQGPGRGYYPEPSKSVRVVHPENLDSGKQFGARHGFKVCTGAHDIGRYIGDGKSKINWLR